MRKILVSLMLMFYCTAFAQPIDASTGNLITSTWTGIGAYAPDPNNCCYNPAGSQPLYDTSTDTIKFSYGQATVQQSIAVNQALAAAGTGIQVSGYSWAYDLRNLNGHGNQAGTDTLVVNTWLTNNSGQNVANTSTIYNTQFDWTTFSGTHRLPSTVAPEQLGKVGISFSGNDSGYWAGLYGPEVRNVSLRLNFGVDPCATNAAYSPNCAGFENVVISGNLVPNPNAYAYAGYSIDQSFAISQALGGSGITVHGFRWGYVANANGPYCNSWDLGFLGCWDFRFPSINTHVSITDNTGATIFSSDKHYEYSYNTTNYGYLFPASRPISTLGNFNFTATTNDPQAYIGSMWVTAAYTPDPCVKDPLFSPTCKGYADAMTKYLASLQPPVVATTTTVETVSTTPTGTISTTTTAEPTPIVTTTTVSSVGTVSASPTIVAAPVSSPVAATAAASTSSQTASQQTTKETSSGSLSNTSLALSIISKNSERDAAGAAVAQSAVSQAAAAAVQAQQEAQATAQSAAANSTSSNVLAIGGIQTTTGSGVKVNTEVISTVQTSTASIVSLFNNGPGISTNMQQSVGFGPVSITASIEQTQAKQEVYVGNTSQTSSDTYTLLPSNAFLDKSNPLNDSMEQKTFLPHTTHSNITGPVVNKNVQDNDLASGISLDRIALAPTGYGNYLNFALKDGVFYAPKELYRNQNNVDNARALRQLTSDSRHKEMVEQQFRR